MKLKTLIACAFCLAMAGTLANAHDTEGLIKLDGEWGSGLDADALAALLDDDILNVTGEGMLSKVQMLENAAADAADADPDAAVEPYVAGDYQVRFLGHNTAIMVHSTGGDEPHWSMHVWHKHHDHWQIVATAGVPIED